MASHQASEAQTRQLAPEEARSPANSRTYETPEPTDKFIAAMFDFSPTERVRRSPWQTALSVAVHVILIGAAIIAPIYFANDALDLTGMTTTMLVAPPAPAPPPPPAAMQKMVRPVPVQTAKVNPFVMPRVIPKAIPVAKNETQAAPAPDEFAGVLGGVEGGVPGGVLGGVLGGSGSALPAPPTAPKLPAILRVGGDVRPPRLLARVEPSYPPIAKSNRVQGTVDIDAVIDPQGNVVRAHAVSGPGLLIPAALAAVEQWKYAPTYLNGQPVSIAMQVEVEFSLGGLSTGF